MTAREIMARLRHQCAASNSHDHDGCSCSDADLLERAGYRLLGPGKLDAETVERCAAVAARHNGISPKDSRDIANSIRALSQEAKPNG